jgi:HEAT repeat protein
MAPAKPTTRTTTGTRPVGKIPPSRWRRSLPWLGAILLLGLGAAGFGLVVKPLLDAHEAALQVRANCTSEDFRAAVDKLGGPAAAAGTLGLYCRTSRKIAPEREWAAWLLGACGPEAAEPLLALLADEDAAVQVAAISGLGRLREPRAIEPLIAILAGSDERLRTTAARTLGRIGDPRAREPLIVALKAPEVTVRAAAATALGRLGDPGAVGRLTGALEDESLLVREAAKKALEDIKQPKVNK